MYRILNLLKVTIFISFTLGLLSLHAEDEVNNNTQNNVGQAQQQEQASQAQARVVKKFDPSTLSQNTISYDSYVVIDQLLSEISSILADNTISPEDYNKIISNILDKNFAVKYMSVWVIANYRDRMTYNLFERYYEAFRQYIVLYYGALVQNYSGQTMIITNVTARNEDTSVVTVEIALGDRNPIVIDWVLKRPKDGENRSPYIVDISVSGISLLATQRAEYETIIRKNNQDLERFIDILEQKVEELTKTVSG